MKDDASAILLEKACRWKDEPVAQRHIQKAAVKRLSTGQFQGPLKAESRPLHFKPRLLESAQDIERENRIVLGNKNQPALQKPAFGTDHWMPQSTLHLI